MGIDTGLDSGLKPRPVPTLLERETGIEPASLAWKAKVLPLNYSRIGVVPVLVVARQQRRATIHLTQKNTFRLVEEAGFEPA